VQLLGRLVDPDPPAEPPSGEVEPGERMHRGQVGGGERAHVADHQSCSGAGQRTDKVAEPGHVGSGDLPGDCQRDRVRFVRRSRRVT
jgi:hypothetical protein